MQSLQRWGRKAQPWRYRNAFTRYPQYAIFCVLEGELVARYRPGPTEAEREDSIDRGRYIILPPGSPFVLSTPRQGYRGHYVEAPVESCPFPPWVIVADCDERVRATLANIEREHADQPDPAVLPLLYEILYHRLLRQTQGLLPSRPVGDLAELVDMRLRAHVFTDQDVSGILAGLPWSLRHLRRAYGAARGRSPKQALLDLKIVEAQRLLRETSTSVLVISLELGFPSSQHFATQFKARCGCSPTQWRDRARAEDRARA